MLKGDRMITFYSFRVSVFTLNYKSFSFVLIQNYSASPILWIYTFCYIFSSILHTLWLRTFSLTNLEFSKIIFVHSFQGKEHFLSGYLCQTPNKIKVSNVPSLLNLDITWLAKLTSHPASTRSWQISECLAPTPQMSGVPPSCKCTWLYN